MAESDKSGVGVDIMAGLSCPIPISDYPQVLLAHGGGGKLSQQIIQKMILPQFRNELLEPLHDGAVFSLNGARVAFSTDSYVINPIFFPGGDIGELAVNGTVNDLAMCGARPMYLSAAFIIEEGFPMDDLWKIILSMQAAAARAGVQLVTGDTKVVDRGKGDKIFINTSGVGIVDPGIQVGSRNAKVGDVIIVSGPIAVHGIAIMSVREGLEFGTNLQSDTAALNHLVKAMLECSREIHVLRDPTRGGVASSLNEIAESSNVGIKIDEEKIPISEQVRGACEILGLDPLYVANEGKLLAFVSREAAESVLSAMRNHPLGKDSAIIGEVVNEHNGTVIMKTTIGGSRVVDMLSGEQLPRIC
ncbi:MAG: hydrogenase expression/formation protein HypE [Ignavibacteriales bacterium]|nr:hydrogenase expression/formation protein HypE [Ignavibacteriales bacterium]